jgi:hypothetical protein
MSQKISILSSLSGGLIFEGTVRKLMKWVKKFEYDVNDFSYYYRYDTWFTYTMYDEFIKWFRENYEYEVSFINSDGDKLTISELKKINFEYENYVFTMMKVSRILPTFGEWAESFINSEQIIAWRLIREIRNLEFNGLLLAPYESEILDEGNFTMYFIEKILQSTCEEIHEDLTEDENQIVDSKKYTQNKRLKKKNDSILPNIIYQYKNRDIIIKNKWKKRTEERHTEYAIKYETTY